MQNNKIYCVNPHRDIKGKRQIKRILYQTELKGMIKKCKVGNNEYPWIWIISK